MTAQTEQEAAARDVIIRPEHVINRNGKDFVLYAGLLDAAHRLELRKITTREVELPRAENRWTAVIHATAHFPWGEYDGIGDANEGNTGRNIVPHIIRMAETRAKARALRDALNVGMAAIEELGDDDGSREPRENRGGGDPDVGTAAPRRVRPEARVTAVDRGDRGDARHGERVATGSDAEEREKYARLYSTAERLKVADLGPRLAGDAPLPDVIRERTALLTKVNAVLARSRAGAEAQG